MADQSRYTAYLNGEWVSNDQVRMDPDGRGFLVGDVIFDLTRCFNGRSFKLKEHIDRLYRSLAYVRLDPGFSPEEMFEISEETLRRNEPFRAAIGDFNLTQFVTRGNGRRAWNVGSPIVCVKVAPIPFPFYVRGYKEGMNAAITLTRSYEPEALDPKVKHHSRMNFTLAELEANDIDEGAWPILTDGNGYITEGAGYNVFIVSEGVVRSPKDDAILQGISRQTVFDLAEDLGIPAVEEDLQSYDVYTADEVFFTSTNCCILPVTRVDRRSIGDGQQGPVTKQLLSVWSERVGLDIVGQMLEFSGELAQRS